MTPQKVWAHYPTCSNFPGIPFPLRRVLISSHLCDFSLQSNVLASVNLLIHKGTICGRGVLRLGENDAGLDTLVQRLNSVPENTDATEARQEASTETREATPALLSGNKAPDAGRKEDSILHIPEIMESLNDPHGTRSLQTSCTITEHPLIPFSTIKSIRSSLMVPWKFRCRVKALAYLPDNVKSFVQMCCQSCRKVLPGSDCSSDSEFSICLKTCPDCGEQTNRAYLFSLILEDETGLIHATLFNQDAQAFLPDLPPPDEFLSQTHHQGNVKQILISLTQNPENTIISASKEATRGRRPWLECCVKSYGVKGKGSSSSTSVLYRIFDTTFVSEV